MLKKMLTGVTSIALMAIVLTPGMISCKTASVQIKTPKSYHTKLPINSFAHVSNIKKIKPVRCKPKQKNIAECKKLIKKLPTVSSTSTGSGMLMSHAGKRFVITAAHVCLTPDIKETTYQGSIVELASENSILISFPGGSKFVTKIALIDNDEDVCLLLPPPEDKSPTPVFLSPQPPKKGDLVYNIAAPLGIFDDNLTLVFRGIYSGSANDMHYYTVPARPGSSGSVVLNKNYQVVGTINVAITRLESVGIGAGWEKLKSVLDKIR